MNPHRHQFFAYLIIGSCLAFLAIGTDGAVAGDDVFAVHNIEVDATAGSTSEARAIALAKGQRQAFQELMGHLVLDRDLARISVPESSRIEQMISDFSVADERASGVRYLADLTVRFQPDEIRQFLRQSNVPFAETQSRPLLILPVYQYGARTSLWADPNPWRNSWLLNPPDGGLVPFVTPLGDLSEITGLNVNQAVSGDRDRISTLATRYDANDAVVALAKVGGDPTANQASLFVTATRLGLIDRSLAEEYSYRVDQSSGESFDALLARAAEVLSGALQEDWKASNLLVAGEEGVVDVAVPLASLNDWLTIQRRITKIPMVQRTQLRALRRYEALVTIVHHGDLTQLARGFAQQDIYFGPGTSQDLWELRLGVNASSSGG